MWSRDASNALNTSKAKIGTANSKEIVLIEKSPHSDVPQRATGLCGSTEREVTPGGALMHVCNYCHEDVDTSKSMLCELSGANAITTAVDVTAIALGTTT